MAEIRRASEVRQLELADAALQIIATKGITALTTRSLAEEVGLSSGAIFRHFASLDDVLEAVVARVEDVLEATYPPATFAPVDRLERFIAARSTAVGDQRGILRLMLSEQFLLALPRSGSERLSACVRKTRAFVVERLREGQQIGEIRSDLPPETLAPIVMGTVQMLALSAAHPRQRGVDGEGVRRSLFTLLQPPAGARPSRRKGSTS